VGSPGSVPNWIWFYLTGYRSGSRFKAGGQDNIEWDLSPSISYQMNHIYLFIKEVFSPFFTLGKELDGGCCGNLGPQLSSTSTSHGALIPITTQFLILTLNIISEQPRVFQSLYQRRRGISLI
jgi:hypothetical protein